MRERGNGRMGEWENGRMGEWENGRVGEWEKELDNIAQGFRLGIGGHS